MSEPRYSLDDFNTIPAQLIGDNGAERDSWQPYHLGGIPDEPPIPPSLGYGFLYPGLRHVFSGPPESAKTLFAYLCGLDVIRQDPRNTILVQDFEMGPRAAKRRFKDLGATDDELDSQILFVAPDTKAHPDRILILVALNPALVIIDAATGAFAVEGYDDNSRADAEKWGQTYVDPFFNAGIATLVLDHVVKNPENRGKYTQGTGRKTERGEVHFGFDTIKPLNRGGTGLYKIITHKDREGHHQRGHLADLHLASSPQTHQITWEIVPAEHLEPGQEFIPTKQMQKASEILQRRPDPLTKNELVQELGGKRDVALKAVGKLIELGYITATAGPRNSHNLTHVRPFTVYEWENQPDPPTGSHQFPPVPGTSPLTGSQPVPPYGGRNQSDAPGNGRLVPAGDDPEVAELLSLYGLEPEPRDDWVDELTPTPDDDLPI